MKYIMMCLLALVLCIGTSWLLIYLLTKNKKISIFKKIRLTFLICIGLIFCVTFIYLNQYYKADLKSINTMDNVTVTSIDGGYFYDGPGNDQAFIFYPGAKVEAVAYQPLMTLLASKGIDCFLAKMPFNMAIFNTNIADKFINNYSYSNWIISGHSMGGLVACNYANSHLDKISQVVLLASYPTNQIDDSIQLLSIYGSNDGCLNMDSYMKGKEYWPINHVEYIIEGGNHAQYGNYGFQKGDGVSLITPISQQQLTVEQILKFINED